MDVYGEYIYVLKIVQLDGLQMVENAKSQQGGPWVVRHASWDALVWQYDEWILHDMFIYSDPASSKQYGSKWSKQKPPRTVM